MSRIRFEWNIETRKIDRSDAEDPKAKRRRRRKIIGLLLLIFLLLAAIALGALLLRHRLLDIENQFAQLLQDTVKAEVAALRIGDVNAFLNVQNAESVDWLNRQRIMFQQYSDLKTSGSIELTGSILAVEIEGEFARVLVQENITDLPYARLWFYRRIADGWQHVAPDYSFWGEGKTYSRTGVVVNYRAVDDKLARQLGDLLTDWIRQGCEILDCGNMPTLTIDIVTDATESATWADESSMHMDVRSPYIDIARADTPFDGGLRLRVSNLLAERLVNAHTEYLAPVFPHDAIYLWRAAIAWLTEQFTRFDSGGVLMRSLAENFGNDKIAQVLSLLTETSDMSLVQHVSDRPLAEANLDWRDFIEWRLETEADLIAARAQNEWLSLYDTSDEGVRTVAYERFNFNAPAQAQIVIDQLIWTRPDGSPQLRLTVQPGEDEQADEEIILFNLVNDVWKRAS